MTAWYRSGQMRLRVVYVHGITHGPVIGWHQSGKLRHQGQYAQGKKVGEWKVFRPDGTVSKRCVYRPDGNNTCTKTIEFESDLIESNCPPIPRRR